MAGDLDGGGAVGGMVSAAGMLAWPVAGGLRLGAADQSTAIYVDLYTGETIPPQGSTAVVGRSDYSSWEITSEAELEGGTFRAMRVSSRVGYTVDRLLWFDESRSVAVACPRQDEMVFSVEGQAWSAFVDADDVVRWGWWSEL